MTPRATGVAAKESARPLGNRRSVLQICQRLRAEDAIGRQRRAIFADLVVDRVVQGHQFAEDGLRLVEALVPGLVLAKDDRHPFRRVYQLWRARDGEQEPLELVIAQRSSTEPITIPP